MLKKTSLDVAMGLQLALSARLRGLLDKEVKRSDLHVKTSLLAVGLGEETGQEDWLIQQQICWDFCVWQELKSQ